MKKTVIAGLGLLALLPLAAQKKGLQPDVCSTGMIDPHQKGHVQFLCFDRAGEPHISQGYTVAQVLKLMKEREDNAWTQLSRASDEFQSATLSSLRLKDLKAEYAKSPRVHDITSVTVGKTMDQGNWVVGLRSADGREASLWLRGGEENTLLPVRSVTPY